MIEAGYEEDKISIIPNSIDCLDNYLTTTGQYIGYIGRLSFEKGYDILLKVADKHPEIQFRFAGAMRDGNENIAIPPNVKLMGYLNKDGLNNFIENSKFIVMPSRCYEGFPMAILEAACLGKPTIGPNHGGFTEIIGQGDNAIGCLFKPNDIDDLDAKITRLWNDDTLCLDLGRKAFDKVQKEYSTEVIYKKWNNLFSKLTLCRK